MKNYEAIIWDIDGTLLNTAEGLSKAYQHCIRELNLPEKSAEELASYIGPVPQEIFQREFGLSCSAAQHATDIFRAWYKEHGLGLAFPYPGVLEVLQKLQFMGVNQAIATNKRHDYAVEICEIFGIAHYCSPIMGANNANTKSKDDLIFDCLTALRTKRALMIGDTVGDAEAAQKVGIDFLGVNYGYGFREVEGYANFPHDIIPILAREVQYN